jgi:hypothetical protein
VYVVSKDFNAVFLYRILERAKKVLHKILYRLLKIIMQSAQTCIQNYLWDFNFLKVGKNLILHSLLVLNRTHFHFWRHSPFVWNHGSITCVHECSSYDRCLSLWGHRKKEKKEKKYSGNVCLTTGQRRHIDKDV